MKYVIETFLKGFVRKPDYFHFPSDYEIAGHMNFVKTFRGNFMMKSY